MTARIDGQVGLQGAPDRAQLFERMADLGPQDVADERAAKNIADLRERFERSTGALESKRFAKSDGSSVSVHDLPWYAVIGAPGTVAGMTLTLPDAAPDPAALAALTLQV